MGKLLHRLEQGNARRKAVHEILLADGAEFPLGKKAGEGNIAKGPFDGGRIVMGLAEETRASSIAGEEETAKCSRLLPFGSCEKLFQFSVRRFLVPNVELHGLTDTDVICYGDRSGWIAADDIANQKITLLEFVLILADYTA